MRRLIVALATVLAFAHPSPANASLTDIEGEGNADPRAQSLDVYVNLWAGGGPARPGGVPCGPWRQATREDADNPLAGDGVVTVGRDLTQRDGYNRRYRKYVRPCGSGDPKPLQDTWVLVDADDELADAVALHLRRTQRVPPPAPSFAPPADRMFVNLGTWFWDTGDHWHESPTVGIRFLNVHIMVEAVATTMTYESGLDGESVTCSGAGLQWEQGMGDEIESPCMFTYDHSSVITDDDVFHASLSINWTTRLYRNNLYVRDLEPIVTSIDLDATVKELQTVIVD